MALQHETDKKYENVFKILFCTKKFWLHCIDFGIVDCCHWQVITNHERQNKTSMKDPVSTGKRKLSLLSSGGDLNDAELELCRGITQEETKCKVTSQMLHLTTRQWRQHRQSVEPQMMHHVSLINWFKFYPLTKRMFGWFWM